MSPGATSFGAAATAFVGAFVVGEMDNKEKFVEFRRRREILLPQGQVERTERALNMVAQMDEEGFGHCTNESECEAACPKEISVENIPRMNREYLRASAVSRK